MTKDTKDPIAVLIKRAREICSECRSNADLYPDDKMGFRHAGGVVCFAAELWKKIKTLADAEASR